MDDLWIKNDGSILKLDQILLPNSLQKKAVIFAHEGHLGKVLTKRLLRWRVWLVLNNKVETKQGRNQSGRLFAISGKYGQNRAPKKCTNMVSLDFSSKTPSNEYLLVANYERARFPANSNAAQ